MVAKEPGWYPDPFTQGRYERFFDGAVWTDQTHPEGGPPVSNMATDAETPSVDSNLEPRPPTAEEPETATSAGGGLILLGLAAVLIALGLALWPFSVTWETATRYDY